MAQRYCAVLKLENDTYKLELTHCSLVADLPSIRPQEHISVKFDQNENIFNQENAYAIVVFMKAAPYFNPQWVNLMQAMMS